MAKLSSWIKKHLRHKSSSRKQSRNQPPYLTSPRRSITPTSLDTPECLFFQLPGDVRCIILIMAFGARTLHMDIERQEEGWKWTGAICYRNGPGMSHMRYNWVGLSADSCMKYVYTGRRRPIDDNEGRLLEKCKIGIMGFLLSCKQAYTEGMHILYSENCISIESEPLLLHLPRLVTPNRLASISALEIVIDAHRVQKDQERQSVTWDHLKPILDNIAAHCHNLRGLCLSFMVADRRHALLSSPALPWVDAFYHSMQLQKMRVELPYEDYWAPDKYWTNCSYQPVESHPREAPITSPLQRSQWRCLDSEKPTLQYRSTERYPYPPLKLPVSENEDENVESSGYWLAEGSSYPQQYCDCF